ncbi:MAG: glutamyl-tRNA reductase [Betaproteobacteria bacterium]
MSLYAIGLNHQTAPLALREQVVFGVDALTVALRDLFGKRLAREAAILSTCNRTEIYCRAEEPDAVARWLADYHRLAIDRVAPHLYIHPDERAVTHAFRVASGLDSMVLGEPQILGQLKQAVRTAESAGTVGLVLNRLFQRSFSVAKEVRTQTDIGGASISMAAASVKLAKRIFPTLEETHLLLIGAGEMIELAATHFAAASPASITVANRTLSRGEELAARFGASAITLTELPEQLARFDIIVTSTASSLPILGKGLLESAARARRHRPIFIVDLAVPRDVEPEARELDDVFLYSVDDLSALVRDNLKLRLGAVEDAEAIILEQSASFLQWLQSRTVVPTLKALREQGETIRSAELDKARRLLANGSDPADVLDQMSRALANKFLHAPSQALTQAAAAERAEMLALYQRIYGFPDQE